MSTAKFNTWLNPSGTENYKCRAWVNFNGTGTVAIRASGNVSSITDNGAGDYTVNFTTAMSDANYACTVNREVTTSTGNNFIIGVRTNAGLTTGSARIFSYLTATGTVDPEIVSVTIFR